MVTVSETSSVAQTFPCSNVWLVRPIFWRPKWAGYVRLFVPICTYNFAAWCVLLSPEQLNN